MHRITSKKFPSLQTLPGYSVAAARSFSTLAFGVCCLAIASWSLHADAVGLGNIEIRSYLGEPLNLRIGVITQQNEEIETGCFAVINAPGSEANVSRRDVRLTLVETKNSRYLEVRGTNAFNEPIGRLAIRAGCQADSGVVRDYPLLLDPAPLLAPAIVTADSTSNSTPRVIAQSAPANADRNANAGRWTVYEGDTLVSLARGIHPGNQARQNQYIDALRELNPALVGIANNSALSPNTELVLPDLKTLSGTSSRSRTLPQPNNGSEGKAVATTSPRPRARRDSVAAAGATRQRAAPNKVQRPLSVPATLPTAEVRASTATESKNAVKVDTAPKAAESKIAAQSDGFRLRISGSEMDLSRSQGITDETRAQLRERFAALDADDQTAQLLALKNTVKQIEKRLNEMQLKMATLPASGALATLPVDQAAVAPVVPPVIAPAQPVAEKPAAELPPVTKATPPAPPPKAATPAKVDSKGNTSNDFAMPIALALSVLALASLAWWALKRRAANSSAETSPGDARSSSDEFNTWVNDPDTEMPVDDDAPKPVRSSRSGGASEPVRVRKEIASTKKEALDATRRFQADGGARSTASAESSTPTATPTPLDDRATEKYTLQRAVEDAGFALPVAAAPSAFATLDRAKNETKSATKSMVVKTTETFDLDLDLDQQSASAANNADQTSEDRLRRLRYMHERYPELAARTVSIDEPESVIHAARLYYEDNQLGKACELLIYAVEERPQEIRFWLAQFELFRREKMVPQFTDLAQKFELLFSADKSWQKVQQAGFGIDPANPLFADGATGADQFNAATENWLDAPLGGDAATQNISEALVADLRASLFAEHRVTHADFERGPTLLNALGERGQA
jgi:hypothetical protein